MVINYKIEYMSDMAGSIPTNVLPGKMKLVFANHYALNSVEGFLGQFSLVNIADLRKETVTTKLKIFDKKYYYKGKKGELPVGVDPMNNFVLEKGTKGVMIAGHNADEWILKREGKDPLRMYSSDSFDIEHPNITTPYKGIDDVLLLFYIRLSALDMVLIAESIKEETISSNEFIITDDYKQISKETMERTLNELFK